MLAHLRANLCLLVFTVVLCCILYPLALWGIGQTVFRHQAQGSLVDAKGQPVTDETKAVGSRMIAQPFTSRRIFPAAAFGAPASMRRPRAAPTWPPTTACSATAWPGSSARS